MQEPETILLSVRYIIPLVLSTTFIGLNGAVARASANGMVGTGFASQYRLQPERVLKDQWVSVSPVHPLLCQ